MATIGFDAESYYGIEDYGNGWYRCYIEVANNENCSIFAASGDGSSSSHNNYTGDGSGVYLYGVQVEANVSYHTSYIPTYGTSASRAADSATLANVDTNGIITDTALSLVWEANITNDTTTNFNDMVIINISAGSNFRWETRANNDIRIQEGITLSGDAPNASIVGNVSNTKFGVTMTPTQIKTYTDGVLKQTFNGSYNIASFDQILIGMQNSGYETKQLLAFPSVLTESEMITLTTP
jgi:hypothetical protein